MKTLSRLVLGALALGVSAGTALAQEKVAAPAGAAPAPAAMTCCAPATDCYSCCNQGCDDGCKRGGIIANIGFMVLQPHWRSNPAFAQENDPGIFTVQTTDFEYDGEFVPRISLGFVGAGGFGARINWWGFDADQELSLLGNDLNSVSAHPLGLGIENTSEDEVIRAHSEIDMDVWDLEALYTHESGRWSALVAGGIRFAHVAQRYNAIDINVDDATDVDESIESSHSFNGGGPTFAFECRRGLGDGGLYTYGNLRGSILFGTANQSATLDTDGDADADVFAHSSSEIVVPVGEIELGVGFRRNAFFAQMGLVGQVWGEVGNSSRSDFVTNEDDGLDPVSSSKDNSALGLFGISLMAGLTY